MTTNNHHGDREWSLHKWYSKTKGKVTQRGWQKRMAETLKVSPGTVSLWVSGARRPGRGQWSAIARYVGCKVSDITRVKVKL